MITVLSNGWTGHRLSYIRALVTEAHRQELDTQLFLPIEARTSTEFEVQLAGIDGVSIEWASRSDPGHLLRHARQSTHPVSRMVIPDGEPFLSLLALGPPARVPSTLLLMRTPVVGTHMTPRDHVKQGTKAALGQLARRRGVDVLQLCDAVGSLQPHRYLRSIPKVRDPAPEAHLPSRSEARASVGLAPDAFILASIGVQRAEKNLPELLRAWKLFRSSSPLHRSAYLLLAGPQADEVRQSISGALDESVIVHDRYLDAAEMATFLAATDAVSIIYDTDYPSALLAAAIRARVPMLVRQDTRVGAIVSQHRLGVAVEPNCSSLAEAIAAIQANTWPGPWPQVGNERSFARALLSGSGETEIEVD